MKTPLLPVLTLALASQLAYGSEKHVHGEAELFVAVEGKQVLLELVSPADNILGFEHQPKTAAQKQQVKKALALLESAEHIATINGGNCKQSDAFVESPFGEHKGHDDHKEHGHDEHKHDEHKHDEHKHEEKHAHKDDHHDHKEEKHSEHKHDHDDHGHKDHHDEETHSEFHATYTLDCSDTKAVKGITATAFEHFNGFEEIDLKWVKGDNQGGVELTKGKATATF